MRVWIAVLILGFSTGAGAAQTHVKWHGHAAFEITTPKGKVLMIDPWLKNPMNPASKGGKDPLSEIKKLDFILVTHGHFDHVGDSVELAKKTGARLVTNFELGNNMSKLLGYPAEQMGFDSLMNIGGEIPLADGELTVAMVPAIHSSGLSYGNGGDIAYGGSAAGFVIKIKDGPTIYHTGDTAYFKDMELIGETYQPDLALINMGGHFGMEPKMAAKAAHAVRAKVIVPHHFKTFPILTQDTKDFVHLLAPKSANVKVLEPSGQIVFEGKRLKN